MTPAAVFCFWRKMKDGRLVDNTNDGQTCRIEDYGFIYVIEFDVVSYGEWTIFNELKDCDDDLVVLNSVSY